MEKGKMIAAAGDPDFNIILKGQGGDRSSFGEDLCLLSLDGGGVRGLSSLFILKRVMEAIDPKNPPKPCDYFDMICGTSTGGLIALMLGRMGLSVDEAIAAYDELSPRIFSKVHHRLTLKGKVQGRFNHEALEAGVKTLLINKGFDADALLKDSLEQGACKTFVCATSKQTGETVVLSSYYNERRGADLLNVAKIWQVARATSAASSFFEPITFGDEGFVDGATGANNPISQLWAEAKDIWDEDGANFEEKVKCLVSIGTGMPSLVPFTDKLAQLGKALIAIATDTEEQAGRFQKDHSNLYQTNRAYRFNVLRGLENVGLEEKSKWNEIKAATRAYIQSEDVFVKMKRCGISLREREWKKLLVRPILHHAEPALVISNRRKTNTSEHSLLWFIHTRAYHEWRGGPLPILWYQTAEYAINDSRKEMAASLSILLSDRYTSFAHFPSIDGNEYYRVLYFQCPSKSAAWSSVIDDDTSHAHPTKVLWCLISQALLLDCSEIGALTRRILRLSKHHQNILREGMEHISRTHFDLVLELFAEVLTITSPSLIALDNLEAMEASNVEMLLRSLRTLLENRLATLNFKLIISCVPSATLQSTLRGVLSVNDDTEYEECLDSLHFPEWKARRDQVHDAEVGTNQWIWQHHAYSQWIQAESGILWIEGKPGSGKSVLAKSIQRGLRFDSPRQATDMLSVSSLSPQTGPSSMKHLQAKAPLISDWFYSTRIGQRGMSHTSLLRSVLFQLLGKDKSLLDHFLPQYRAGSFVQNQTDDTWTQEGMILILQAITKAGRPVICVLDALDESEDARLHHRISTSPQQKSQKETIISTLSKLISNFKSSRIKFLVLSRPDPFIELDFRKQQKIYAHTYRILLEWENRADIQLIIDKGLRSLRNALRLYDSDSEDYGGSNTRFYHASHRLMKHKGLRNTQMANRSDEYATLQRIRLYLTENAHGVILWVALILSDLETHATNGLSTFSELEELLRSLPLELDTLYQHIFESLEKRLSHMEFAKARLVLMLVSGSGTLGRPILTRELWDALAVPDNLAAALQSKEDPIKHNRAAISSWNDFRRQLRRKCGPLIDFVALGDEVTTGNDGGDIGPDHIVQLIHRTVKDFFEHPMRSGLLHFSESSAEMHVKETAKAYARISFPAESTLYAPAIPARQGSEWPSNIEKLTKYLDEKILLNFILSILPSQMHDLLGPYTWMIDDSVSPSLRNPSEWSEYKFREVFDQDSIYYSSLPQSPFTKLTAWNVMLGHAFRYSCSNGLIVAAKNLYEICSRLSPTWYHRVPDAMRTAALLAAIDTEDLELVKFTTTDDPVHGSILDPLMLKTDAEGLDPFLNLAMRKGIVEIAESLFDQKMYLGARQVKMHEGTRAVHSNEKTKAVGDIGKVGLTRKEYLAKVALNSQLVDGRSGFEEHKDTDDVREAVQWVRYMCLQLKKPDPRDLIYW